MSDSPRSLVLASASPRRVELLNSWAIPFEVRISGVSEEFDEDATPEQLVTELAMRKAGSVAATLSAGIVIGADTTVAIDGQILNKPEDADDAVRMLNLLRGRTHEVWTGVVVIDIETGASVSSAVRSLVHMHAVPDDAIARYVATGEPLDKAGAYAIQSGAGLFVRTIEGCYANVVGLPLCELAVLLERAGYSHQLRAPVCALASGEPCPRLRADG
jgi:septum formation protein